MTRRATKNLLQPNSCRLLRKVISARRVIQREIDYGRTLINCRVIQKLRIFSSFSYSRALDFRASLERSISFVPSHALSLAAVPIGGDSRHLLSIYHFWLCRPTALQRGNSLQRHPNEGRERNHPLGRRCMPCHSCHCCFFPGGCHVSPLPLTSSLSRADGGRARECHFCIRARWMSGCLVIRILIFPPWRLEAGEERGREAVAAASLLSGRPAECLCRLTE